MTLKRTWALVRILSLPMTAGFGVGCAGAPNAVEPVTASQPVAAPQPKRSIPWSEMSREQRTEYMGLTILPAMDRLFRGHDIEAFSKFRCQTCHGEAMQKNHYAMPSDTLFALDATDPVAAARQYDPEMTAFMTDQVMPQMAELLGAKPEQFTCFNCHSRE